MTAPMIALLTLHIGGGIVAIITGTASLSVGKGGRLHMVCGRVFFLAMLVMSAMAASLAALIPERGNLVGGLFTFYLIGTAWMTVRRGSTRIGGFERVAPFVGLGIAVIAAGFGIEAGNAPDGMLDRVPPGNFFFFGGLAAFAAAFDLKLLYRGGIDGAPRIRRHIWRVCTGLFIATGSFFLGQQKVMPVVMQGSPWLFVPALAPLVVMVFWMVRSWFRGAPIGKAASEQEYIHI